MRDVRSCQQPAVSYANVGQLSLDLLINTLLQGKENAAVRAHTQSLSIYVPNGPESLTVTLRQQRSAICSRSTWHPWSARLRSANKLWAPCASTSKVGQAWDNSAHASGLVTHLCCACCVVYQVPARKITIIQQRSSILLVGQGGRSCERLETPSDYGSL